LTKTQLKKVLTNDSKEMQIRTCTNNTIKSRDLLDRIEVTVKINLKAEAAIEMPMFSNQKWVYYRPINVNITSFVLHYTDWQYSYSNTSGGECLPPAGSESAITRRRQVVNPHIYEPPTGPLPTIWIVVFDSKTNKALKMIPGGYRVDYGYNETETRTSREWPDNSPDEPGPKSRIKENNDFDVGPVEEVIPDPYGNMNPEGIIQYLKEKTGNDVLANMIANIPDFKESQQSSGSSKIHPDLIVKTGDGIKEFGGEGHKTTERKLKGGLQTEELNFTWNMKRKVK
jgi:hypothetical protein